MSRRFTRIAAIARQILPPTRPIFRLIFALTSANKMGAHDEKILAFRSYGVGRLERKRLAGPGDGYLATRRDVAVYLSPDPGPGSRSVGQPYLIAVDDTPDAKQRFALVLTALSTGQLILGYDDGCSTAIWAQFGPPQPFADVWIVNHSNFVF